MKKIICLSALLLASFAAWAKDTSVTLAVPSMACSACETTVKKALEKVEGVSNCTIDMATKQATITYDSEKTTASLLAAATKNAGFPSTVVTE